MGGLYIPDVNLPVDEDFELWIAIRKDGSFTYNVRGGWRDGKQKVVPVPSHGRLIDADILAAKCDDPYWCVWLSDIDDAPTVIQAEPEEEEMK